MGYDRDGLGSKGKGGLLHPPVAGVSISVVALQAHCLCRLIPVR